MKNIDYEQLAFEFQTTPISLTKLAEREHVDRRTLSKYFRKLGIEIINKWNITKFNDTIFDSIDTEEKAYWLGFIYADGTISSNNNTLELSICSKDISHLYKFDKFMQSNNAVTISKIFNKKLNKIYERCRWIKTNKHLWNTLNNYGCTPRKSLTLKFPNEKIFKDKSLIRHFIRGYFDGDGCISRHVYKKTVSPNVELLGTKQFLEKVVEFSGLNSTFIHDKRHNDNTFSLTWNLENSIKFINYLYKESTVYLDRKYKMYEIFKNGSRSIKEFIELSSGNIGKNPEMDDAEINLEITKGSESSYSIESE